MINNFHRYLNLPFDIKRPPNLDSFDSKESKHIEIPEYCDQNMINWLKSFDIETGNIEAFYTPPKGSLPIHCDESILDNHVKINVTWGSEKGVTRWWHCPCPLDNHDIHVIDNGTEKEYRQDNCLRGNESDCDLVYEANTNRPSLLNVGQMHSTYNPDEKIGRWTLCFVLKPINSFKPYIYWNDALGIFKDYLVK
jgi:hypothetical protein